MQWKLSYSTSKYIVDEDLPGDHLLAETLQPLSKLIQYQGQKKIHLQLERPNLRGITNNSDCPFGLIVASNVGKVELSLAFYAKSGTFKVTVVQCLGLPQMTNSGSANPFVQV